MNSFAQNEYKKPPALGISFFLNDFQTATEIRNSGLVNVLRTKEYKNTSRMNPGLAVSYMQGLGDKLDFVSTVSASFLDYAVPGKPASGDNNFLLDVTAVANLKLVSDKYWVSPYMSLGVGASKYLGYYGAFFPAGLGIQVNFWDDAYLLINSQYRVPVTENVAYHFYHSIGFAGSIAKRKIVEVKELPAPVAVTEEPKDSDKDGVVDENDKCPDVPGIASLSGCPDRDKDAIADADDKCPDVAGLAKYGGCPIPDTDKDGVNDENDKCVDVAGVARFQGCPVPDTDKDGVNDEEDKCPSEAGLVNNYGCPEIAKTVVDRINIAAKNIFFVTGSYKLLAKSNKALNDIVRILNDNPSYKLDADGHTDITGKPDKNQVLSENRAKAVVDYLKTKGIDESRITATGHGQDEPIADNKTTAGRSKNRRVELKAKNY